MSGQLAQDKIESILTSCLPGALRSKAGLQEWFLPLLYEVQIAAVELHDFATRWLEQEKEKIRRHESSQRDLWFLFPNDAGKLTKSLDSLRTKLGRDLLAKPCNGCLTLSEVEDRIRNMPDLARFRIVCDFASDAELLLARLVAKSGDDARFGPYKVRGPVKDYVYDLSLRHPTRGHRARQFAVEVPTSTGGRPILVEIQIMTLLQHAWDRRNHPFYEWTRCGRELPPELVVNDIALAETLFLVDRQAAENWQEFLRLVEEKS